MLVVEDEEAIRTGLMDVFVYHGYGVDYAADGAQGLEKGLSGKFDLILLDVMLPGMDGFEICERFRASDREQPIIMLTAKTSDEDIIQGLSLGADDYVAKPFSVAQLVLRVKAVLRRSRIGIEMDTHIRLGEDVEVDVRNLAGRRGEASLTFTRRERSPARSCWPRYGATPRISTSRPAPWTSTSPSCAARSNATPASPVTW